MRRAPVVLFVLAAVPTAVPAPPATAQVGVVYRAELNGASEVPPTRSPATGSAVITVASPSVVCADLTLQDLDVSAATGIHLHVGAAGVNGPHAVDFTPGRASSCITGVDPAVVAAIAADPAGHYFNVHTADFPDGAIRGQLAAAGTGPGPGEAPPARPVTAQPLYTG